MATIYLSAPIKTAVIPTIVGATVGLIGELLIQPNEGPRVLERPGMKILAGIVTGVAFGILKHFFGYCIAIPVIAFALFGLAQSISKPLYEEPLRNKIKQVVGMTLIGALIGYGLHSFPESFWNTISEKTLFHVHLNR
jgi:hypothetical protein